MRIDFLPRRMRAHALGAALLLCIATAPVMAAAFSIDPDPSSPTLGEMLEREARKPAQKAQPLPPASPRERKAMPAEPAPREAAPKQHLISAPKAEPVPEPAAPARVITPVPHVPRNAATVILPRPPQRPIATAPPREIRRIDLSAARPGLVQAAEISPEITSALAPAASPSAALPTSAFSPAADIRTEVLALDDIPFAELVRVMRAAEFDAVRYPLRQVEGGSAVSITATLERVARLEQLISLLKESRRDTAIVSQIKPEQRAKLRAN